MQLTGLAVLADSAVVVDAVSGIRVLLYLGDKDTLSDSMESAAFYKENIALMHRDIVCHFKQSIVLDTVCEFLAGYLMLKAVEQLCAFLAVNDIPHLGLAVFALDAQCILVVRVNLNGEIVLCVDEFYEDREILEALTILAEHLFALFFDIFIKRSAGILAVFDHAFPVFMA